MCWREISPVGSGRTQKTSGYKFSYFSVSPLNIIFLDFQLHLLLELLSWWCLPLSYLGRAGTFRWLCMRSCSGSSSLVLLACVAKVMSKAIFPLHIHAQVLGTGALSPFLRNAPIIWGHCCFRDQEKPGNYLRSGCACRLELTLLTREQKLCL